MKFLSSILILIASISAVNAQYILPTMFPDNSIFISEDSLFSKYSYPKFPEISDSLFNGKYSGVYFFCYIEVDTNQRVSSIGILPLYGFGNSIERNSQIWEIMIDSIRSTAEKWEFKRVLYPIEQMDSSSAAYRKFKKVNEGETEAAIRPFHGKQSHFIIMKYGLGFWKVSPHFLYFLDIGTQFPK